jgi:hypothetical protein
VPAKSEDVGPTGPGGLPLPSPMAGTNLVIADIVLRAAGTMLRNRMEKGLLIEKSAPEKFFTNTETERVRKFLELSA